MSILRAGKVYVRKQYAGLIQETDTGYCFQYDGAYLQSENARPVSLTLPLQTLPFHSHTLFPFFDGLIPEGWLLNIASRNWKISTDDRFGLMLVTCRDCIGCVTVEGAEG